MQYKVGAIVCLKSGGPRMTVLQVSDDGVHCSWFVRPEPGLQEAILPAEALVDASTLPAKAKSKVNPMADEFGPND